MGLKVDSIHIDIKSFHNHTRLKEMWFFRVTAATENNCFQFPIKLQAGESPEDSWVLITHQAPAGWDIDPCMTACLAKPPNGWLLMHVCVWVCVWETLSKRGKTMETKLLRRSLHSKCNLFSFHTSHFTIFNTDGAFILKRCSTHLQFLTN